MKRTRKGFTLIEVGLFLAITGALFISIMVGTQNSIWQQRFNDSVQSYADFLRSVYSEVLSPQSIGNGRSEQAIYGKLITFGQTVGVDGEEIEPDTQKIFVYDVVGDATSDPTTTVVGTGTVVSMLKGLNANVLIELKNDSGGITGVSPAGFVDSYSPIWGAAVETTATEQSDDENMFKGSILIVRHPKSGTINTLFSSHVIEVNKTIKDANYLGNYVTAQELLKNEIDNFGVAEVNFCINPYGPGESATMRRNVRIIGNARNASGVEIIDADSDDNKCIK